MSNITKTAGPPSAPVLPVEAEVRADDIGSSEAQAGSADEEAEPGKGENAPGFLKRGKNQPEPQ